MTPIGAVLAGGRSRRFGSDKATALLGGRRLIDRVVELLAPQVDAILVCGRAMADYTTVPDRPEGGLGPLAGLNAALHHARAHGYDSVISVPCDVPDLPSDLAERLAVACAYCSSLPVIGRWPSALADELDRHLAATDDRSMRAWAVVAGAVPIDLGELANVNTLADLRRLDRRGGQ